MIESFSSSARRRVQLGCLLGAVRSIYSKRKSKMKNSRSGESPRTQAAGNGILKALFTPTFFHGLGRKQFFQESELTVANPSKADLPRGCKQVDRTGENDP